MVKSICVVKSNRMDKSIRMIDLCVQIDTNDRIVPIGQIFENDQIDPIGRIDPTDQIYQNGQIDLTGQIDPNGQIDRSICT